MSYSIEEVNKVQAKINYLLVEVDEKTISVLRDIIGIIKVIAVVPAIASHLRDIDFGKLESVLDEAEKQSGDVADIIPPGCQPPPY